MQTTAATATLSAADALDIIREYLRSELAGIREAVASGGRTPYLTGVADHARETLRYLDRLEKRMQAGRI